MRPREGQSDSTMESPYPTQLKLSFGEGVKLLVVEDDADTLEMVAVYFSQDGYIVTQARSGKEALAILEREPDFDLVLLDLFIPDIGGMEVLTEINRQATPPSVILLTGLADKEIAHDALRLGAFDYILKPYSLPQVESSVVACLAHREYLKQSWWKRTLKSAS
jgi:DNA-binding response OmpR family regulator